MIEESVAAVVERVRALVPDSGRRMLGITGPPGVGKSTLVETLGAALRDRVAIVGMDGFHLASAELERLGIADRKGAPDTFDAKGYAALLARLHENRDPVVYAPRFDRDLEESIGSAVPVSRDVRLVITEGNYLLLDTEPWTSLHSLLDEVWYLDSAEDERIARLVARHVRYGRSPDEARVRVTEGSDGHNARLVAASRDRADLVLTITG